MIAQLQRRLIGLFGLFSIAWALTSLQFGRPLWSPGGLIIIVLLYAIVLGLEFAIMRWVNAASPAARVSNCQIIVASLGEILAVFRTFAWWQPFRSAAWPDWLPATGHQGRGIVLVHGFACNRGVWNGWAERLTDLRIPFVAVSMEPPAGSIDDYMGSIEPAIQSLERCTGMAPVVVAHSMGGLAVRKWWAAAPSSLRARPDGSPRLRRLITIGSPHQGAWIARCAFTRNGRELRPASNWLQELRRMESPSHAAHISCFYSQCDNIVFPPECAQVVGADNRPLHGIAHLQMVGRPELWLEALRWLEPEPAARDHAESQQPGP